MSRPLKASATSLLGLLDRLAGEVLQGQAAERQRQAVLDARAFDVDQFERAAAEIADNAVRLVDAGNDAERGELRFALARQNFDLGAADAFGLGDESAAVLRVAAGGGGDRPDFADVLDVAQRLEADQRGQRRVDGVLRQQAGGLHLAAETGQHLFVENRRRRARQTFVDDEADRVRADVDDGDRRPMIEPALDRLRRAFTRLRRCAG